jgi:hypothetical protein
MTLSFSEPEVANRLRSRKLLYLLISTNLAFAVAVLVFWTTSAIVIEGPAVWGTSSNIERDGTWRSAFVYPYVLLWAFPVFAALIAQTIQRQGKLKAATFVALTPILLFCLTFTVYHFAPLEMR